MLRLTKICFIFTFIFSTGVVFLNAQETEVIDAPRLETGVVRVGTSVSSRNVDEEEEKGSTVRGRVFYQDTGRPVRHGWIGFSKIKELVAPPEAEDNKLAIRPIGAYNEADKYALTDGNGEFEIKNIKAGIYQAIVKVPGVLNPGFSDKDNPEFRQYAIDGVSDAQTEIGVRRGASISGRIFYPDGDPIISAKVQVFKKNEAPVERYSYGNDRDDITTAYTDDRGFYRFAGLPAGEYIVRVTEKTSHTAGDSSISSYMVTNYSGNSELKTYYPNASSIKGAAAVQAFPGEEQTGIDISVPDRRLFRISGSVIAKSSKMPLEKIAVSFSKIDDDRDVYPYSESRRMTTDEQGKWSFKELPKGKYRLTFSQEISYSYDNPKPKTVNQPKYASVSREIEIDVEDLSAINVELPVEATVSGTITVEGNKPFPDFVSLTASDGIKRLGASSYISRTEQNGKLNNAASREFKLDGLSEGNFYLLARTQGYYVKSIRLGSRDLLASSLEIKDGDVIEGVQIVLGTDVGTLKGNVSSLIKGKKAFVVLIQPGKPVMKSLQTSVAQPILQNGDFEIKAAPGDYLVIIGTEDNRPEFENLEEWFADLMKNAQAVTLKANEITLVDLSFPN